MPNVLHFPRDMSAVDMGQMIGPDMHRRYLGIKSATGSTVTLYGIMPDEYRERVAVLVAKETERERIRALFNG